MTRALLHDAALLALWAVVLIVAAAKGLSV